jgi:hypothetical protein
MKYEKLVAFFAFAAGVLCLDVPLFARLGIEGRTQK